MGCVGYGIRKKNIVDSTVITLNKQGDNVYYDTDMCKQLHTSDYIDYFRACNIKIINDTRKGIELSLLATGKNVSKR